MTVTTRIEPISDFVSIVIRDDLSPEGRSKAFAGFAREKLAEAQQKNRAALGIVPPHETYVDGRQGAPLESVKADGGRIVFEFELGTEVLAWIAQALLDRSPVRSGAYRKGHTLFADGREISFGAILAGQAAPPAETYTFTNPVPYTRKIEIGKTKSGRPFVLQVQNRIFERTAADAKRRFGNLAQISFTWRDVTAGGAKRRGGRTASRQPAIVVTARRN